MGRTKELFEEMTLQELIMFRMNNEMEDDDYQYQLWREEQLEEERSAYEEHLADKYQN